jgi:hypothetical protein
VLSRFKKEEMEALQADILRELEKSTKDWLWGDA